MSSRQVTFTTGRREFINTVFHTMLRWYLSEPKAGFDASSERLRERPSGELSARPWRSSRSQRLDPRCRSDDESARSRSHDIGGTATRVEDESIRMSFSTNIVLKDGASAETSHL